MGTTTVPLSALHSVFTPYTMIVGIKQNNRKELNTDSWYALSPINQNISPSNGSAHKHCVLRHSDHLTSDQCLWVENWTPTFCSWARWTRNSWLRSWWLHKLVVWAGWVLFGLFCFCRLCAMSSIPQPKLRITQICCATLLFLHYERPNSA